LYFKQYEALGCEDLLSSIVHPFVKIRTIRGQKSINPHLKQQSCTWLIAFATGVIRDIKLS
jgi:hypothetical protein